MTKGSPFKHILTFTIPLFFGNLFQQVYSMVDSVVVGRFVGVDAIAALGAVSGFSFMVVGFAQGIGNGFGVLISQSYGARHEERMRKTYAMSIVSSVLVGIIASIFFYVLSKPLLRLTNTPESIFSMANDYISVIYIGLLSPILYNMLSSVLRAVGDSKSPVVFLLISSGLNVILDLVFVLTFHLGCFGVAVATVLSQGISAFLSFIYIQRKFPSFRISRKDFRIDSDIIRRLLAIGLPGGIQFSVCAVGTIIVQAFLNPFGEVHIAAYSVGCKIEQLYSQFFVSLGMAISTYAGQNLGYGAYERIKNGFRDTILIGLGWSLISLLLNKFLSYPLALLFVEEGAEEEVISLALEYTDTTVIFFVSLLMIFTFRTGCQGLGSGAIPMISSITEVVGRVLACMALPGILGYKGICLASPVAWTLAAVVLPFAYMSRMAKIKKHLALDKKKEG